MGANGAIIEPKFHPPESGTQPRISPDILNTISEISNMVVISLKNPECNKCKKIVKNMEMLNVHMKNVHQESDHDRILRITEMVKSVVSQESMNVNSETEVNMFDCSECVV